MDTRSGDSVFADERGIALPLALMMLMVLASTTIAFVAMSATEPRISANLTWGAQALGLAEAGVERTIWALTFGGLTMPASAPYDGTGTNPTLGPGEYRMVVTAGAGTDRNVTSEGYMPSQANTRGFRRLIVTVTALRNLDPPCALCVRGTVSVLGNSTIDARTSTCGSKKGVSITSTGTNGDPTSLSYSGAAGIYGGDGNDTPNQPSDYSTDLTHTQFDAFTFTQDELNLLRSMAKRIGTYIKPTSTATLTWSATDWNPPLSDPEYATKPKDGLIFVDTVNGEPLGSPPDPDKLASVKIKETSVGGNSGWLIVMGSLQIDGDVSYKGMMYALNDLVYRGTGSGTGIEGAMISQNIIDTVQSVIDTSTMGNAKVRYDCNNVKNGNGFIPTGYFVKPGTWREISG